ncbi:sialate O-acetylesterase [Neptunicella sp. SCSIO 80796]|uniref:sialate O-acetylesterase n=1 Tax=Neptunicella plasticusilytica TaxID=3117012 RepID=UPI003A4DFCAD
MLKSFIYLGICVMSVISCAHANLQLSPLFSDHMVLQRDKPIHFWGQADPGERVTVKLKDNQVTTLTDAQGQWQLHLPAIGKGGPYLVTVSGKDKIVLNDVYLGDVWIAGGQSNMEWKLDWGVDNIEQEMQDTDYPQIRFFDVPNTVSANKETQLPDSSWQPASKETAGNFSAVAWFFAKQLHQHQDVAVGIIDANWGGTPAEAWTDVEQLTEVPGYQQKAREVIAEDNWPKLLEQNAQREQLKFKLIGDEQAVLATNAYKENYDVSKWQSIPLPNKKPLNDFVWLRKSFVLDHSPQQDATLVLGDLVQEAFIFVNGELIGRETWQDSESRHTLPKAKLHKGNNLLAIRIANSWDNNVMAGRPGEMWLQSDNQKLNLEGDWLFSNNIEQPMPEVVRYSWVPGFLYNAMIHPLLPYTSTGVIWYQGESNVGEHQYYYPLFSTMIRNWRDHADNPELPFLFVQLAAYLKHQKVQPNSAWAYLRDSQKQTLSLDNTGMAVTIDIGNQQDVHPRNKQDVGKRLWLQANNRVYGQANVPGGPDYQQYQIRDDKIIISFKYAEGLASKDNHAIKGFIIAGEDKVFYPGIAKINGETVTVSNPAVKKPVAVRYAWSDYPEVNLVNTQGLPATPFRTDNWPASEVK